MKFPSIPKTPVADPSLRPVIDAIRTSVETGTSGPQESRWVTWEDLQKSGVVIRSGGGWTVSTQTDATAVDAPTTTIGGFTVERLLRELEGQIKETHLYKTLNERIDLIDGDSYVDRSVEQRINEAGEQIARTVETVATKVGDNSSAVQVVSESVNGVRAQYTVKIDNNGFVTGYGLASELVNGTPFSNFIVNADRFSIVNPSATLTTISSLTRSGTTATVTWSDAGFATPAVGSYIVIQNASDGKWNGTWKVATSDSSTKTATFTLTATPTGTTAVAVSGKTLKLGTAQIPFVVDSGNVYISNALIKNLTSDNIQAGSLSIGVLDQRPTVFVGSFASEPTAADYEVNNIYRNTTDGDTYILISSGGVKSWTLYTISGADGAPAKSVRLVAGSQVFNVDKAGASDPSSITLTAVAQNLIGTPTFSITSGTATLTAGASSEIKTISFSSMSTDAVTVEVTWDSMVDRITIVKVYDGSDAVNGVLTNESHTFSANSGGDVSSYTGGSTQMLVFVGGANDSGNWTFSRTNSTGITSDISGNTVTVTGFTGDTGYIDITASRTGYSSITKRFTLGKSKAGVAGADGSDAVVSLLTNSADVIAATSTGGVTSAALATLGGTFRVFDGATEKTGGTSVTYSVESSSGMTASIAPTGVYTVSALSADTATATLKAVYTVGAVSVTLKEIYTVAKSRAGTNGAAAQLLTLSASSQTFTYDKDGNASPASQTITFTANLENVTGTPVFTCTPFTAAGVAGTAITLGGTGTSRTLSLAQFGTYARAVVTATLSGLIDTMTVVRVKDGTDGVDGIDAKTVTLSASSDIFKVAKDKTGTPSSITLTAKGQNVAAGTTPSFTVVSVTPTNGTVTLQNTATNIRTIAYSGMNADVATIRVTWDGMTDDVTIAKVVEGSDALTLSVPNSSHTIPAANDGAVSIYAYTGSGTTIRVLEGSNFLTFVTTISASGQFSIGTPTVAPNATDIAVQTITGAGTTTATVPDHKTMNKDVGVVTITYPLTIRKADGTTVSLNAVQTISKSFTGAAGTNAKALYLYGSSEIFKVAKDKTGTPSSITLTANQQNLAGSPTFSVISGTATLTPVVGANAVTLAYSSMTTDTVGVRVTWDGLTDELTIAKVAEGSDALTVSMPNSSHTVSANSGGVVTSYAGSGTTVQVLEGSNYLTYVSTISAPGQFTIGTRTVSLSGTTPSITPGSLSGAGTTTATAGDSSGMLDSVSVATITYPITVRKADGSTVSLNAVQTVTKAIGGANGGPGATGQRGTVNIVVATSATSWSDTIANSGLSGAGYGSPVNRDVVTLNNTTTKWTESRYYDNTFVENSSNWHPLVAFFNGNLLVKGTVIADSVDVGTTTQGLKVNTATSPNGVYIYQNIQNGYGLYCSNSWNTANGGGAAAIQSVYGYTLQSVLTGNTSVQDYAAIAAAATASNGTSQGGDVRIAVPISKGGYAGYANRGTWTPFTGSHDGLVDKGEPIEPGDILVDGEVVAVKISDSLTVCARSTSANQRAAIGVYVSRHLLDPVHPPAAFQDGGGNPEDYTFDYNVAVINAVGEGAINVCGENGNIEAGDLIVTSSIPGKGMKQSDDIVRAITVAKARESVTFSSPTEVKMIACIYLCG